MQYFAPSETVETEEQGTIQYYDIVVDGKTLKNGAWICNSKKDWVGFRMCLLSTAHSAEILND